LVPYWGASFGAHSAGRRRPRHLLLLTSQEMDLPMAVCRVRLEREPQGRLGCLERRDLNATLRGRGDGAAILARRRGSRGSRLAGGQPPAPLRPPAGFSLLVAVPAPEPRPVPRRDRQTRAPGRCVEPDAGTGPRRCGEDAPEVAESMYERRGSSVAGQLIRKEPQMPADSTQRDVTPGNQTPEP
jgi:hypothetical protein